MTFLNSNTRILAGARPIRSGFEYERYFPKPDNQKETLKRDGTIDQTVFLMGEYIKKYQGDTAKIAQLLKAATTKETCKNIWEFVYNHIQYKLDKEGEEQLRRPAYLWATRQQGGDCDCMTIFVCTVLYNLGIPFKIRIVKYYENRGFQHVYPIVPLEAGTYYTIDCVVSLFNYEKPFILKKDYTMTTLGIPIVGLHGIPSDTDDLVNSLGAIDNTSEAVYDHLVKTRDIVIANKGIISHIDYEPAFLQMLDYAIEHFWTSNRDEAFKQLAWNEAIHNRQAGVTEEDLLRDDDEDESLLGVDELDGIVDGDDVYEFDGLGRTSTKRKERKALRKQQKAEKKMLKASQKKNKKKAAKKMRKAEKKVAKGFFRKAGVVLAEKAGRKSLLKHNPVMIAQQQSAEDDNENIQDESVDQEITDTTETNEPITNESEATEPQESEADDQEQDAPESIDTDDETVEGLLGLGRVPTSTENEIYHHLVSTRAILRKNPKLIPPHIDYTPGFLSMLDYAITHFWTPNRENAMRVLAMNEAKINRMSGLETDDLLGDEDEDLSGIVDYDNVYEFNGLGELGDKNKRKQARAERKAEKKANKEKNKAERKQAKGFFRKVGVALKQGAKTFKTYNPALIAMRNSFLLVMKINLFGFAAKAKWGYATPEQAKAAGISDEKYQKSKHFISQLEKIYADRAGGSKVSLKRNILASKKAHLNGNLGTPAAAPIVAAIPLIAEVVKLLKENGLLSSKEADDINKKVKNKDLKISDEDAKELTDIEKEESANDSDGGSSSDKAANKSNDDPNKKNFFQTIWEAAKEHPYLATTGFVVGALALTYMFSGRFRSSVNGMLHIGSRPTNKSTALNGIGKQKALPPHNNNNPKKLKFISLK